MLAEDHPVNQRVTQALLTQLGHQVSLADDGQQCLDLLKQLRVDVLLLDMTMPHKNGQAVLKEIRRGRAGCAAQLPVVMLTGQAMSGDEARFRSLGADGYLSKPINLVNLEKEMMRLCLSETAKVSQRPTQ